MRNFLRALLIAAVSGIVPVAPQASAHWECMGPAFACESATPAKSSYHRGWQNEAPTRRIAKRTHGTRHYAAQELERRPVHHKAHRVASKAKAQPVRRQLAKVEAPVRAVKTETVQPNTTIAAKLETPKQEPAQLPVNTEAPKQTVATKEVVKPEPVKVDAVKTVAPKQELAGKAAPKTDAAKQDVPKQDLAKLETVKPVIVKPDAAKLDAAKQDIPKQEAAKQETTKQEMATVAQSLYQVTSTQTGMASYYGTESGSQTASGQRFNPSAMTAAHRTLPFGTHVRVTNRRNGRSVIVTINDRGPFVAGRIIDLSTGAAGVIGMRSAGVAPVSLEVLARNG
jgi:rare lipoprotein A